jgi:hypothetical protein
MKNLIGIWPHVFRAIEIAKTGGFTVSMYYNKENKAGSDDYKSIVSFCKGWFDDFVLDGDINIELIRPQQYHNKYGAETLDQLKNKVMEYLKNPLPENRLCDVSEALLKDANRRFEFSLAKNEKIKKIALTIARMEGSRKIEAHHIAEATQYNVPMQNDCVKALFNCNSMLFEIYDFFQNIEDFDKAIADFKKEVECRDFDTWQESKYSNL